MYEELMKEFGRKLDDIDGDTISNICNILSMMLDIIERNNLATEDEINEIYGYIQRF